MRIWIFLYTSFEKTSVRTVWTPRTMCVVPVAYLGHRFSKCSVRSPRAPREKPRGSASCSLTYVFIFRNFLWGSVNYGQSLHGLHNTKSLRNPDLGYGRHAGTCHGRPFDGGIRIACQKLKSLFTVSWTSFCASDIH